MLPTKLSDKTQVPAYIAGKQSTAEADAFITGGAPSGPRISLRGRRFRILLPDADKEQVLPEGAALNAVLVGAAPAKGVAKVYYAGAYNPDEQLPPDCSSSDGVRPDSWVATPQSETCATCPHNAWGSSSRGKGKACRDIKRVFVLPANQIRDGLVFSLVVPPTSLKHLSAYAKELKAHGVAPQYVVTQLAFADSEYPELLFRFARFLTEEEIEYLEARREDVEAAIQGSQQAPAVLDDIEDGEWVTPQPKVEAPKKSAPKAKVAPEPEESAPAFAAAKAAPKKSATKTDRKPQPENATDDVVAKILGDWAAS